MTRLKAETSNGFSVFFLKEHGYLPQQASYKYGGITWSRGDWKNYITFQVSIEDSKNEKNEVGYVELIYKNTVHSTGEVAHIRYKVLLVATACRYGGRRYWFLCSLSKNGIYCGRRVGVLYNAGKWFGCRYCANIAYGAQFEGGAIRAGSVSEPDVEKAYDEIKRKYYNNKPTRRYKR